MPSEIVRFKWVAVPLGQRIEVLENAPADRPGRLWHTFDPWVANVCRQAVARDEAVSLTWIETRYGLKVTDVRLLRSGEYAFERQLEQDRV